MSETDLYEQLAQWLSVKYPELKGLWHFDLSGLWTPSHKQRNLYGRLNQRAWPDFFLARPAQAPGLTVAYNGLFIELKREGTKLKKRDATWAKPHFEEQARKLDGLRQQGFVAEFAVGVDEAIALVAGYLSGSGTATFAISRDPVRTTQHAPSAAF